ncbi:D-lactate dehydrogenase (cytochrome) [Phyllobacterium myrsinacearum]|uniref:FAD-binding oxidoreductase n=1 Tax=Phyllobacterium myrsinacearum TaxID=28101 RepID=UPI0010292556|nr:FAD-binding oxidoreductase [Phyllobacterium myrsinacearum]RZS76872.1 D-lactate dehydrogenase (cytochrome) [Phyllobacterium myrsinacearum]
MSADTLTVPQQTSRLQQMQRDLGKKLSPASIVLDPSALDFFSNDIFWQSAVQPAIAVVPQTIAEAVDAVKIAGDHGATIVPRGGGLSYAGGYVPPNRDCVTLDMRQLSRVVTIDVENRFVTVEAGCTWAELHDALLPTGFRTPYWGPMSGRHVTIGGALSHISAFYGSSEHGTVAESVLGVSVILADGSLLTTGAGGRHAAKPFTRYSGGPDLTGLFLGDNGAFGVKVAATLRLIPRTPHVGYLSFGFETMRDMIDVQIKLVDKGKVAESFGIDRNKAEQIAGGNKDARDLQFLLNHNFSLHLMIEEENDARLEEALTFVRALAKPAGTQLPDAVPRGIRRQPFGPVRGVLSTHGERWVPTHATFPLGDAIAVAEAMDAHFQRHCNRMAEHGIRRSHFTMCIGSEFFYETAFYWQDCVTPLHTAIYGKNDVPPHWHEQSAQLATRTVVSDIRRQTQLAYAGLGGASWQVARDYPFKQVMQPQTYQFITNLKRTLDPLGIMNPGALGDA